MYYSLYFRVIPSVYAFKANPNTFSEQQWIKYLHIKVVTTGNKLSDNLQLSMLAFSRFLFWFHGVAALISHFNVRALIVFVSGNLGQEKQRKVMDEPPAWH